MSLAPGVPRPTRPFRPGARAATERQQGGLDLLACTVADLEGPLESRTRAVALRRFLIDETPRVLPSRVSGVAQPAWDRLRTASFLQAWSEVSRATSVDGTLKIALGLGDATVETVLIPASGRSTVCVSSQAGCTRRCDF
jgi:hypothetical protein